MNREVGSHPAARQELRESADFYDLEKPGLGSEFLDDVERAIGQILEFPESAPVALGEVRKHIVARFPYSVMYSVRDGAVYVSAIAHNSRRPFYWQHRI